MGSFFLECKENLSCAAGLQGASFLSESREGKCRCHSWDRRFILASKEEKYFQKEKRRLRRIPSPSLLLASMSRTSNLQKPFCLLGLGCCPACCFFFGVRPLWWERGGEKQADPEGRLSPSNSAGVQGRGQSQSKDGGVKGKRLGRCHQGDYRGEFDPGRGNCPLLSHAYCHWARVAL